MLIFGLILFLLILIVVGLAGALLYLFYLPIKKRLIKNGKLTRYRSRQINRVYVFVLFLFSAYQTFVAFFPSRSFYEDEFKTVTLREIPKSAEFIERSSSYPDLHGDYCSSSQIKLSEADYQKLLSELIFDNSLTKNGQLIGSAEFTKSLGDKNSKKIVHQFIRQIKGQEDHFLFIGFYEDRKTIFVNICVTQTTANTSFIKAGRKNIN